MGDSSEGTFRKATGSVFPDCFIIGVSVQSSEGSQFSCKAGLFIIAVRACRDSASRTCDSVIRDS